LTPAQRLLTRVRRVVLFLAAGGALYGFARFDVLVLPEGAVSPLFGLHPGDRMLVDRHAREGALEETWLYRDPSGALLIGRAVPPPEDLPAEARQALAAGALWLCADRELPGVADSRTLGPIGAAQREGRVILVLPW